MPEESSIISQDYLARLRMHFSYLAEEEKSARLLEAGDDTIAYYRFAKDTLRIVVRGVLEDS